MALLSPTVVWHQPGENKFAGEHTGPEAVGALLASMMDASEGACRLTLTGPAMVNRDLAAVPVRFSGTNRHGTISWQESICSPCATA